jgi:hypothetical protein
VAEAVAPRRFERVNRRYVNGLQFAAEPAPATDGNLYAPVSDGRAEARGPAVGHGREADDQGQGHPEQHHGAQGHQDGQAAKFDELAALGLVIGQVDPSDQGLHAAGGTPQGGQDADDGGQPQGAPGAAGHLLELGPDELGRLRRQHLSFLGLAEPGAGDAGSISRRGR